MLKDPPFFGDVTAKDEWVRSLGELAQKLVCVKVGYERI